MRAVKKYIIIIIIIILAIVLVVPNAFEKDEGARGGSGNVKGHQCCSSVLV